MTEGVDISVIIPNYNSGNLLEVTLKSIFSTGCDYRLEVIVVDNLSTDQPDEILKAFPTKDLVFCSESDQGIYDAMNKGIRMAKGNWLIFMGAGDELLVEHVNQMPLRSDRWMMVYGDVYLVQTGLIYDGAFDFSKLTEKNISHQAIFYRSEVFQKLGDFDIRYKITADYLINLAVFLEMKDLICYHPLTVSRFLGLGVSDRVHDHLFHDHKFSVISKLILRRLNATNLLHLTRYCVAYFRAGIRNNFG
jgi:glycosyltransferase involved in cell wall biosynthesis